MSNSKLFEQISKLSQSSLTQVEALVSSLSKIESRVAQNKTLSYNFRFDLDNQKLWESCVTPELHKYKKNIELSLTNPNLDLIYRSRYDDINPILSGFIKVYNESGIQSVVISDLIMFNKNFYLKLNMVDRLLPYCKFAYDETNHETYQLDGWVYSCLGSYTEGSNKPHYSIKFNMESYRSMDLLVSEEEKRLAVRAMIQIMNECDIQDINLNSYYVISEWYRLNDSMINSYNTNLYEMEEFKQSKKLDESQVPIVFNTNQLLTSKEIINTMYSHAINGSNDQYSIYGKTKPIEWNKIDITKPIRLVNGCMIGIDLTNTNSVDLSQFLQLNGLRRTGQVIERFKHMIKTRVNMNNYVNLDGSTISAPELLVELHNNLLPTGMNILQLITNPVKPTIETAKNFLNKSSGYIDYWNGIAFKIYWIDYPILDIGKFESRHGDGSFAKCLKNFIPKDN